jgi:anaerobic magnesium-protoporphyrin IX monomethyl ester cyclase
VSVDILLVNPLYLSRDPVEQRLMTPYFPLGLLYLAATLRDAGYSVAVYDGTFQSNFSDFSRALDEHRPAVVGFGVLSTVRPNALELASLAHGRGMIVLMGGADPTARPASYLLPQRSGQPPVDFVVVGEGEETIVELMPLLLGKPGALPLERIRGLAYRSEAGEVVYTAARPLRRSIDEIPFPARDLIDIEAHRRAWRTAHGFFSLSIIASRGCPYECAWCQKGVFGRSYRPRAAESVAEEMRQIKGLYHPDQLRIVDDVTGIERRWVKRWRDALVEKDAVTPFECLSRVDLIDRDVLGWLKEAGCVRIALGAESGSQRVLDAMTKGTRVHEIYRAAELCHEFGIEVYLYIMVGYPGEEWKDIQATMRMLRQTLPDQFSSTIAYPLPGTKFYEQVHDQLTENPDWAYTAENRLLHRGRYNTRFYRWVQRWFHMEWQQARLQAGRIRLGLGARIRARAGLWLSRLMVRLLRHVSSSAPVASIVSPSH